MKSIIQKVSISELLKCRFTKSKSEKIIVQSLKKIRNQKNSTHCKKHLWI